MCGCWGAPQRKMRMEGIRPELACSLCGQKQIEFDENAASLSQTLPSTNTTTTV